MLCGALALLNGASAQSTANARSPLLPWEEVAESPAATPPRLLSMPAVQLPAETPVRPEELLATVQVEPDGRATLADSSASAVVRARLRAALSRARFAPAMVDGEPRRALVRVRFQVAARSRSDHEEPPAGAASAVGGADGATSGYGARAEVTLPEPQVRELSLAEMRAVPGAFGDPFRVLETLPGVVPLMSGVSYVYVRGASPAGTQYVYDGIPVPALFHMALGPAVVHPRMLGDLTFYAAVPPARYGRFSGGVFAAEGLRIEPAAPTVGELELRLIDAQAMISTPLGAGRIALSGRFGYPGLLLSLLTEASLSYWDYQLRFDYPLLDGVRSETLVLGSHDALGERGRDEDLLRLQFHRVESRLIYEGDSLSYGVSLLAGYEESSVEDDLSLSTLLVGPRAYLRLRLPENATLRLGSDFSAIFGQLRAGQLNDMADPGEPGLAQGGEGLDDLDFTLEDELLYSFVDSVPRRQIVAFYGDLTLPLPRDVSLSVGLRSDVWITAGVAKPALDPRLLASVKLRPTVTAHLAAGVAHQLAVMPIPLPGLSDLALVDGLQTAYQSEVGLSWEPLPSLEATVTGYYNFLDNLVLAERSLLCGRDADADGTCRDSGIARGAVHAYGAEFFFRKAADEFPLSGWLSYTLGWAIGMDRRDEVFTPEFDIRHVFNLVLQCNLHGGLSFSGRIHLRSGGVAFDIPTFEDGLEVEFSSAVALLRPLGRRLPAFFRTDIGFGYSWEPSWGRMRLALEWLNLTLSREARTVQCSGSRDGQITCRPDYLPALFFPNIGLRAEF